jgi:hypothetical protein
MATRPFLSGRRERSSLLAPWRRGTSELCCQDAAEALAGMADGTAVRPSVVSHVEYCLSCQAELARYHKMLRLLHQLKASDVVVPPGIVADVLSSLEGAAKRRAVRSILTGRRLAYGSAMVAAGGAATALVALARARAERPGVPVTQSE